MSKWCGKIGYLQTMETKPGVWEDDVINERLYYGELIRNRKLYQNSGGVNDDINLSNQISIIADPFVMQNFQHMKYVEIANVKWKISDIEVQYNRLILTIGGVYNG